MSLKSLLISGVVFSLLGISSARAEYKIDFVEEKNAKIIKTPPEYLRIDDYRDASYVYISAIIENPDGQPCVKQIGGGIFSEEKLDVVLTAQISGFFGIDSDKEIPIATYAWSSEQKSYCQSVWKKPVTLVPPTPLGVKQGLGAGLTGSDEPTILLRLRTSTQGQETLSSYAKNLLNIAATVATGGAADTVIGLTKLAGGPTATILADSWSDLTKVKEDRQYKIVIPTTEIARGLESIKFTLTTAEKKNTPSPNPNADVVQDINNKQTSVNKMLSVKLQITVRRSMFDVDDNLKGPKYLPEDKALLRQESILQFPRKNDRTGVLKDYPTVFQQFNSSPPTTSQNLANGDKKKCEEVLNKLRDLGFNKIDRALVMGALLDDARSDWRSSYTVYGPCLDSEPTIKSFLESIYPERIFDPTPIDKRDREVAINTPIEWQKNGITDFMNEVRRALRFETSSRRLSRLRELFNSASLDLAESIPDAVPPADGNQTPTTMLQLSQMQATKAGCIFAFTEHRRQLAALVFVAKNTEQKPTQYLLMTEFASPMETRPVAKNIWVKDISKEPDSEYVDTLGGAIFDEVSICSTVRANKRPLTMKQVIDNLVIQK